MESDSVCVCTMGRGRDHSEIQSTAQWGGGREEAEEESCGLQKFQKHQKKTEQEHSPGQVSDRLSPPPNY